MSHNPRKAIGHNDQVGPLQKLPLQEALNASYDVSQDCYWVFHEQHQLIFMMLTHVQQKYVYGGGIRLVCQNGNLYTAMSVELSKNSSIDAYNRAMSVIKH